LPSRSDDAEEEAEEEDALPDPNFLGVLLAVAECADASVDNVRLASVMRCPQLHKLLRSFQAGTAAQHGKPPFEEELELGMKMLEFAKDYWHVTIVYKLIKGICMSRMSSAFGCKRGMRCTLDVAAMEGVLSGWYKELKKMGHIPAEHHLRREDSTERVWIDQMGRKTVDQTRWVQDLPVITRKFLDQCLWHSQEHRDFYEEWLQGKCVFLEGMRVCCAV